MSADPYKSADDRAFWSRSVVRHFDAAHTVEPIGRRFDRDDRFMSAGSCFASNVRRYLDGWGYSYTVTERVHPQWPEAEETMYYEAFSARYGNVYTARQMAQLLLRCTGSLAPAEEFWLADDGSYIDPFRPGLSHRAHSLAEFRALTEQHLRATRRAVEDSTVFVFTLGLTEAWYSVDDGSVFPACPGTVAGEFDPSRHRFANFGVDDVTRDLEQMITVLRAINPAIRVVLTVSPVPLVATASGRHVLPATSYSKSVLRVAAGHVADSSDDVYYFPAYEIVTGPQQGGTPFEADLRTVKEPVIAAVMSGFARSLLAGGDVPEPTVTQGIEPSDAALLAVALDAECEEMMADDQLKSRQVNAAPSGGRPRGPRPRRLRLGR